MKSTVPGLSLKASFAFPHSVETLNICMINFDKISIISDKMTTFELIIVLSLCIFKTGFSVQIVHTMGIQLVLEPLLKVFKTR